MTYTSLFLGPAWAAILVAMAVALVVPIWRDRPKGDGGGER